MNIHDYADAINATIKITRWPNNDLAPSYCASFESCEIKGDGVLIGTCGRGESAGMALADYVNEIKGKTIVFDAYSDDRREFRVPAQLEL